ncbi:MAG: protein kinase [Myxococcota bacterium]
MKVRTDILSTMLEAVGRPDGRLVNARLGNYQLERKLGTGGMGEVFAARHVETGKPVALKILSSTTGTRLYRFKREFRVLADLSHRNLVHLFELVIPPGGPAFFTMELLDGQFFVDWVRGSTPVGRLPDLTRLRSGLRQLVEGVSHLHAHDCVHRDLKPSNVLVTGDDRVVVLDFGLVSELSEPDKRVTCDRQILGTPVYMAPEQARGERVGPAADYYAIGVILYECLTGRVPYESSPLGLFAAKQEVTVDPGVEIAALPEDLRALCVRLLTREPESRPVGREVLDYVQARDSGEIGPKTFVGRREELSVLQAALRAVVERSGAMVVHLRGRSGYGKSTIVHRFRSGLRGAGTIVLHGRCREQETMPYKGIDAIVDVLSSYLRRLPPAERTKLRPVDLAALIRVFPVFDDIWERPRPQNLGQREVLRLGEVTLRKLLCAMSEALPLVVHIDDFQWADTDSVRLLEALVRPPQEPKILLVLSYRAEAEGADSLRVLGASKLLTAGAEVIELRPLPASDAHHLARSLLWTRDPGARTTRAQTIALRSRGNPFFITQMVLNSGYLDSIDTDPDHFVSRCLADLDGHARRLLELVAVSGGPLSTRLACDLAGVGEAVARSLCGLGLLVRDPGAGDDDRIEAAHDRIREVVLADLDAGRRILLHRRLGASLLARAHGDPPGDSIFAVVDHVVAGVGDFDSLASEHRLELARLGGQAGHRALESGAWVAARRYFCVACELVQPWLAEARGGEGHYHLCVSVVLGRAQAEVMLDNAEGDDVLRELLRWSLTMTDYCRIAQWYCEVHFLRARFRESMDFGIRALAHIGLVLPRRRPTWVRSLLCFYRGWRAIWKVGLDRVHAMPTLADERTNACMELIALTSNPAAAVDVRLQLPMMGAYCQLLTKHGLHDRAGLGLAGLALSAVALGKYRQARVLVGRIEAIFEDRGFSMPSYFIARLMSLVTASALRPVDELVAVTEQLYHRGREMAPRAVVEILGTLCLYMFHLAGTPLQRVAGILEQLQADSEGFVFAFMEEFVSVHRLHAEALMKDSVRLEFAADSETTLDEVTRNGALTMRVVVAFLLGDYDCARQSMYRIPRDYHRQLATVWFVPVHAMMEVVVMADRWPEYSARERWRMHWRIRRHRATAARWARGCPENFGPMLDVIEGEVATLNDDYARAMTAYEHARARVCDRMPWLRGLVCERLGRLAQRHGHTIVAKAALDAARDAYEAWGAAAVVRRLDRGRAAAAG